MKVWNVITFAFFFVFLVNYSNADQRSYVWTYEYMIMEPGQAELEQYTTFSASDMDNYEKTVSTELNLETEIGMSKHYDFAIYQTFKQSAGASLKYDGYKLRARFLIGEKNQFFMDPLIYLEYKGKADFSKHVFEPKIILAKDFGDFNIALNPYCEIEQEGGSEWEFAWKYAFAASYKPLDLMSIGLEAKGDETGNYIGPTISHGSKHLWGAIGTLYKIGKVDEGKPEFQLRFILGIHI